MAASGPASAAAHGPGTCSSRLRERLARAWELGAARGQGLHFPEGRGSRVTAKGPRPAALLGPDGAGSGCRGLPRGPSAIPARQPAANESGPGGARAQLGGCSGLLRRPRQPRLQEGTRRRAGGVSRAGPLPTPGGGTAVTRQRGRGAGAISRAPRLGAYTCVPPGISRLREGGALSGGRRTGLLPGGLAGSSGPAEPRAGRAGMDWTDPVLETLRPPAHSLGAASETRHTRFRNLPLLVEPQIGLCSRPPFVVHSLVPLVLIESRCPSKKNAQPEDCELRSVEGLPADWSPGKSLLVALRDCSREVREEPGYIEVFAGKTKPQNMSWNIKRLLVIMRGHTQKKQTSLS